MNKKRGKENNIHLNLKTQDLNGISRSETYLVHNDNITIQVNGIHFSSQMILLIIFKFLEQTRNVRKLPHMRK